MLFIALFSFQSHVGKNVNKTKIPSMQNPQKYQYNITGETIALLSLEVASRGYLFYAITTEYICNSTFCEQNEISEL